MTPSPDLWHGTTILTVRKGGVVAMGGAGQVSTGQTIVKANAKKVRRLAKGDVIGGFAGATADAFTLFERLQGQVAAKPRPAHGAPRAARGQARAVPRPADARRGRACQGLAHRPLPAPARSHDDRRRQGRVARAH